MSSSDHPQYGNQSVGGVRRPPRRSVGGVHPPPQERLELALLSSPQLLLQAAFDNGGQVETLRQEVFQKLKLELPVKLPDSYTSSMEYSSMMQRLVIEEALFSILNKLEKFDSKTPGQLRYHSVRIKTVSDEGEHSIRKNVRQKTAGYRCIDAFTCWPLSAYHRKNLRAGAVVVLVPTGKQLTDWDTAVFGYIYRGSDQSAILPLHMQDNRIKKAKRGYMGVATRKTSPCRGDRLVLHIFGDAPVELELYYVTTMLNSIRQFRACKNLDRNPTLDRELQGNKAPSDDGANKADDTKPEVSEEPDSESSLSRRLQEDRNASRITILTLNESQQQACDGFVSDRGAAIQIVQGPPGTGKTTMIVATIMKARPSSDKRRLLVCGPSNKSVVVLIRKILQCLDRTDTLKVTLIGDKNELFADHQDEICDVYAYGYLKSMTLKWKALEEQVLKDETMYERYDQDTASLLSEMKSRLITTNLVEVETSLLGVRNGIKNLNEVRATMKTMNIEPSMKMWQRNGKGKNKKKKKGITDDQHQTPNESLAILNNRAKTLAELKKGVQAVTKHIQNLDSERVVVDLLTTSDVIFCTLTASGSAPIFRMKPVDALIVDETSACTEPDVLIPLREQTKRMLLVGDPKQLPSVVTSPAAVECGLSRSLQDRLMFKNDFSFTLLNQQYRMKPEISKWPLKTFYDDKVVDGENVTKTTYNSDVTVLDGDPYSWVQVSSEEKKDKALSTYNEGEAEVVASILLNMKRKYRLSDDWFSADRLRVITFYQAQVDCINLVLKKYSMGHVMVSTVDSSQGCEADIVILSFVRGGSGRVGFLKDNRRLNVGLTRARFQLVCVGNLDAISHLNEGGGHLQLLDLSRDARDRARVCPTPIIGKSSQQLTN